MTFATSEEIEEYDDPLADLVVGSGIKSKEGKIEKTPTEDVDSLANGICQVLLVHVYAH